MHINFSTVSSGSDSIGDEGYLKDTSLTCSIFVVPLFKPEIFHKIRDEMVKIFFVTKISSRGNRLFDQHKHVSIFVRDTITLINIVLYFLALTMQVIKARH